MEGVEILNQYQAGFIDNIISVIVTVFCTILGLAIYVACLILIERIGGKKKPEVYSFLKNAFYDNIILALIVIAIGIAFTIVNSNIRYDILEVTISDDVNFNEFQEHYEIIDHRGQIYTVKEIKSDSDN